MKFYYLIHKIMGNKSGILKTVAVAAALVVSPGNAETSKQVEQQKIEQKVGQVTCKTKLACDVLSSSIQAQIDGLNKKIQQEKDPKTRFFLQQDLTKLKKEKGSISVAIEKKETAQKDQVIVSEKEETAQKDQVIASKDAELTVENNKQEKMRQDQDKKIEELRGVLL